MLAAPPKWRKLPSETIKGIKAKLTPHFADYKTKRTKKRWKEKMMNWAAISLKTKSWTLSHLPYKVSMWVAAVVQHCCLTARRLRVQSPGLSAWSLSVLPVSPLNSLQVRPRSKNMHEAKWEQLDCDKPQVSRGFKPRLCPETAGKGSSNPLGTGRGINEWLFLLTSKNPVWCNIIVAHPRLRNTKKPCP